MPAHRDGAKALPCGSVHGGSEMGLVAIAWLVQRRVGREPVGQPDGDAVTPDLALARRELTP